MNTDDTQTWISGGYKKYRDDYFLTKNSCDESSNYVGRFDDAPVANRSRAALILTEVEEQLEANESRYNSVKDQFDYLKMLYLRAGTVSSDIGDSKPVADEAPITENSSPPDTNPNSPLDDEKASDDNVASGGTQYYDFHTETQQHTSDRMRNDNQSTEQSPRRSVTSYNLSPERNIYHGVRDENSTDSGRQNYFSEENTDGMKFFVRDEQHPDNAVADDIVQIHDDHGFGDTSTILQHPYQQHLAEYSKSIHEEFEAKSRREPESSPTDDNRETLFDDRRLRCPTERDEKFDELLLNLSESVENLRTMKNKKSRSDKQRKIGNAATSTNKKNVVKQIDDTLCGTSKIRRKKRRVRASNSRSTTATRDTRVTADTKKDPKKRKQRGHATMPASQSSQHRRDNATKMQRNWNEIVNMYYNDEQKSESLSVVSSNHSTMEPRGRNLKSANDQRSAIIDARQSTENDDRSKRDTRETTELRRSSKFQKNNQRNDGEEIRAQTKMHHQALRENVNDIRPEESKKTKLLYRSECPTIQSENNIPNDVKDNRDSQSHRNPEPHDCVSTSYDPLAIRNYELPTVASKMKRVNRSYFNRFNFKNIPFVVGTSVTPSYNLGLNIQETLSLIKTRQMMPGGVTQLLINKVGKGSEPTSTFMGSVGHQNVIPIEDSGFRFDVCSGTMCNVRSNVMTGSGHEDAKTMLQVGPFSLQAPRLSCVPTNPSFCDNQSSRMKTIDVSSAKKNKIQSICSSMKVKLPKNGERHLQLTQSNLLKQRQEELNIENSQSTKWRSEPHNKNGIQEVLTNFHDQLEAMNTKYEKLQEEAEKSNDESLKKEMAILEKDLTAKEEEIHAVVDLYMEVMALKQQMKLLHERNSLVCIATESPGSPMYPEISCRARATNPMFNIYKRCGSNGHNRGPSTSTRLAGLLRQMKIFQKQLKSAT